MYNSLVKLTRNRLYAIRQKRTYINYGDDLQINLQSSKRLERKIQNKLKELQVVIIFYISIYMYT